MRAIRPTWISFGGTAAIVTSMGLILGLDAAASSRQTVVSALLIFALADNLTDSLSVHAYQEAERLEARQAFASTVANFAVRLLVALSFVAIVAFSPRLWLSAIAGAWGFSLLSLLTYQLARARNAHIGKEVVKHIVVAACVIVVSRWVGAWVADSFR
jgi:VIT1/CCC1 family predicted Fe2+/Mn2+ transporter